MDNYKYFVVFIISLFISLLVSPAIKNLGVKYNLYDKPDSRKQRVIPMVRLGGIGIAIAYFFAIFLILFFNNSIFFSLSNDYLAFKILIGSFLFLCLGIADDLKDISPFLKLLLQIVISSFIFSQGLKINLFDLYPSLLQSNELFLQISSHIITIFWIVGVTNAINWIDGLDGLATGFASISSFFILILSILNGQQSSGIMISSLLGSTLGFLQYNYFPSKILMGDSGSYFIGFNLACLSLISLRNLDIGDSQTYVTSFALLISLLILIIPVFDMTIVILQRVLKGNSPFFPDRGHFHHKILRMGFSEKKTVLIIYSLSIISGLMAVIIFMSRS